MGLKRAVHEDTLAALNGIFHPVLMVYLDWPGGAVRAHSGAGTITWDGHNWLGVGQFGEVEIPGEAPGLAASNVSLSLLGVPPDIWDTLEAPIRNRPGRLWVALTTQPGGNVLVGEPIDLFIGHMDAMRYRLRREDGGVSHAVQIDLGSGPGARSSSAVLHSLEDQADKFPGDTAGRHLINVEAHAENEPWPK